ncbi:MAG: UrcA family protein [Polymorphobacter sp.]
MFASLLRTSLTLALATSATLLTVAGSAAPAGAAETPRIASIDTRGFDLASSQGRARVEAQVRRAAARVCDSGDQRSLRGLAATRACTETAMAAAMPRLEALAAAARDSRTAVAATVRDSSTAVVDATATGQTRGL